MFSTTFFFLCLVSLVLGQDKASAGVSVEFTSNSDPTYLGSDFNGEFFDRSTGTITGFMDLTQNSNEYYWLVSEYNVLYLLQPITIISNIYDEEGNIFYDSSNVISRQLPYEEFAGNQSIFNDGQGLLSCTNPLTYDIIICYEMQVEIHGMIYCDIFFNNYLNPKWSGRIRVDSKTIPLDPITFSIQCLHDSYLILFQTAAIYEDAPNTLYTLLDLNGDVKVDSQPVFNGNRLNLTSILVGTYITSHQNRTDFAYGTSNYTYDRTNILLLSYAQVVARGYSFFLYYTNISDINQINDTTTEGPLYVNYTISGNKLLTHYYGGTGGNLEMPVTQMKYYEMNKSLECCYMMTYFDNLWKTDPLEIYQRLYLSVINGEGEKMFENDTLIITIPREVIFSNSTTSIHQLNIVIEGATDEYYFGITYNDEYNLYMIIIGINPVHRVYHFIEKITLINTSDFPGVDNEYDLNFNNIYVDSEWGFSDNVIFFMYQTLSYSTSYNSSTSWTDFVQSWTYSVAQNYSG